MLHKFTSSETGTVSLPSFKLLLCCCFCIGAFFMSTGNAYGQITIDGDPSDWCPVLNDNSIPTVYARDVQDGSLSKDIPGVSNVDNQFTQGTSDVVLLENWRWSISNVSDKNDLGNVGVAITDECNLYFFADRFAANGDTDLGLWIFKNPEVSLNADGTFSGTHLDGDLLITSKFTNGGGKQFMRIYIWEAGELVLLIDQEVETFGIMSGSVNSTTTVVPSCFDYRGKFAPKDKYTSGTFFEATVDLCKLEAEFGLSVNIDACFSSIIFKTSQSQEPTSANGDLVFGAFDSQPREKTLVGSDVCGSDSPNGTVTLEDSSTTECYQLQKYDSSTSSYMNYGAEVCGTGDDIVFEDLPQGEYQIVATTVATECTLTYGPVSVIIKDLTGTYEDSYTVCDGDTWTFSYDSDGDGNDESYGPYGEGVHTEDVTDINGCPYQLEFTVDEYDVTDTYMDSYTVCDGDSWTFSYDSDGDGNDESYGPYGEGVHTEDVTDINGCPYQLEFTVDEYDVTDTYTASYTVCDGGTWTFSYDSDGDGNDESYGPYGAAGSPHVENVTDINGCPYDLEFTVYENDVTDAYQDSYTVCDGDTWTFSYDSDGDGNDESYGPYGEGVHTEEVTDINGCPYQLEFTVDEYDVTDTYTASYTVCDGDTWTFSYDSDGDGNDESYGPYGEGVHTEDVTDINGCTYQLEFTVDEYDVTDTYTASYTVCDGDTWTFSYDSDGDGNDESYGPYGAAGSPHVENVFDINGCPYDLEFTVYENPIPACSIGFEGEDPSDLLTACDNATRTYAYLGVDETYNEYLWEIGAGGGATIMGSNDGTTVDVKPDAGETSFELILTITANYEGAPSCPSTCNEIVAVSPAPIVEEDEVCVGDTVSFFEEGATYESEDEAIATIDANGIATGVAEGGVLITVTVGECASSAILTVNPLPNVTLDPFLDGICLENGPVVLGGGLPVGGVYSGTGVTDDGNGLTFTFDPSSVGAGLSATVTYTYESEAGCSDSAMTDISVIQCVIECDTVFGYNSDTSLCFLEDNLDRWGWTNHITTPGEYRFTLYGGSGNDCDPTDEGSPATEYGFAIVNYDGETVTVHYETIDGNVLNEIHVYIGCTKYPMQKKGKKSVATVAPGQYNFNPTLGGGVQSYDLGPIEVSGDFYIILHGVACDGGPVDGDDGGSDSFAGSNAISCLNTVPDDVSTALSLSKESSVRVSPNPFVKNVEVNYEFDYNTKVDIEIVDIMGNVVRTYRNISYSKGENGKKEINLTNALDRMLFVRVTTEKETMIKQIISSNNKR
ncbi:Ig-like domain (group 2) [Flavobacteriaceae bacterium MAR_2010_188]|nr:Ig-like domain (group 2) [Flavobacteriaceae bacterium MAR_2010_188]